MKRLIFPLLVTALLSGTAGAGNPNIKRSDQWLKDSTKAKSASDLAFKYRDSHPDSSFLYAEVALELSEKLGLLKLQAYSHSDLGNVLRIREQYKAAEDRLKMSLKLRFRTGDTNDIASGYNNLGLLFNQWERFDSAAYYYEKGLKLIHPGRHQNIHGILLSGLATTKIDQGEYPDAEQLLTYSLEIAHRRNDSTAIGKRYHTFGKLYQKINRFEQALDYYQKALGVYQRLGNAKGETDILINQGAVRILQGQYPEAIKKLKQAEKLTEEYGYLDNRASIYINLGFAYQFNQQFVEAEAVLEKGLTLSENDGKAKARVEGLINFILLKSRRQDYKAMMLHLPDLKESIAKQKLYHYQSDYYWFHAQALAGLGDYRKAHEEQLKYDHIRDSLNQIVDRAQETLALMEQSKRDQLLLVQKNELQRSLINQQKAEFARTIFGLIALSVVIVAIFLVFLIRARVEARRVREKKKSDEQLSELLAKIDLEIAEKQLQASDAASDRIGKDLHDSVGSKLSTVQNTLVWVKNRVGNIREEVISKMDDLEQLLEDSCKDVRNLSHSLRKEGAIERGLVQELKQFCKLIDGVRGIQVHFFDIDVPSNLSVEVEEEVLKVCREAINNALRHSEATEVTVQVFGEEKGMNVSIEDNGKGFNLKKVKVDEGMGIESMEGRVKSLAGEFTIESFPGRGTSIMFNVPTKNEKL